MRIANKGGAVLALLALLLAPVGVANAQIVGEPIGGFAGNIQVNAVPSKPAPTPSLNATLYDNTPSAPNFGLSSTDLTALWGDQLFTTGTGVLSTMQFTIFNSGSSAGSLLTANVDLSFYDANTSASLGSFSTNVGFGSGLPAGFFSIITVTNLDPLAINLNVTDILVLQTVTSFTGPATRLGIASLTPVVVGASPDHMYIDASTIGGGVAGYYNLASGPAQPGYQLQVALPPVSTQSTTWSRVKKLYR